MSETGFRQEPKTAERPRPSPRDSSKSSNEDSSPLSPGSPSAGLVQILPESKPSTQPTKTERNFAVRYDPNLADAAASIGSATNPKRSGSPENVTASTTRPVPRPRPRSMVVSRSEPVSLSSEKKDASNDKMPPPVRPEPATRPASSVTRPPVLQPLTVKGPKSYHVVGCSVWYDGASNAPPRRPPPVKPKPLATNTGNESDRMAEQVSSKIPSDVGRRKPTIIRPGSSVEHTVGPPVSTVALPLQGQTTVSVTASSTSVASGAETNGWNRPSTHTQPSGSNMAGDVGVKPATEDAKPQPKKRPTVIRQSRPALSDGEHTSELPSSGPPSSNLADEERNQALPQSSAEVSRSSVDHGLKSRTAAVVDSQPGADRGSLTAGSRQPITRESEDRQLRPVPRSQSQPLHSIEPDLNTKVPPAKPPPPRPQNTAQEQNAVA